jgi:hypothetical protein
VQTERYPQSPDGTLYALSLSTYEGEQMKTEGAYVDKNGSPEKYDFGLYHILAIL